MMGKAKDSEPKKLTRGILTKYQKRGFEVKCSECGRKIQVGEKYVRRGGHFKKWFDDKTLKKSKVIVKFYCLECWEKMYLDLPEATEEEIERGEVLTVPFLILDEVKLKW